MGGLHAQIIPVVEMPEFFRKHFPTAPCLCLEEKNAKEGSCGVFLLLESTVKNTLKRIYKKKEKASLLHVDSFAETLGINFSPDVQSECLQFLYEHALNISNILNIEPPAIMLVRKEELPEGIYSARVESMIPRTGAIGNTIKLVSLSPGFMLQSLAHELRHCWQGQYQKDLLSDYKFITDTTSEDYLCQPAEIDAEAFADFYVENNDVILNRSYIKKGSMEDRFYELVGERKKEISEEYNGKVIITLQRNEHEEKSEELNDNVQKNASENHEEQVPIKPQSNRYKKIQGLKSQGYSIGQIARKLGISYQAVSKEWQ